MMLQIGKKRQRSNSGFTLIELLLIVITISVLAGLTAPLLRGSYSRAELKKHSQQIVSLMRYLQNKAIAERKICRLDFDLEKKTFWAREKEPFSQDDFARIEDRWGRTFKLAPDTIIEIQKPFVTFYPNGSSDERRITLTNKRGESFSITTQKKIGYIKIEENTEEQE